VASTAWRLRHQELLDAAHITADTEETGEPLVSNGLSPARCTMPPSIGTSSPCGRTT
jgi:hypothetical protein